MKMSQIASCRKTVEGGLWQPAECMPCLKQTKCKVSKQYANKTKFVHGSPGLVIDHCELAFSPSSLSLTKIKQLSLIGYLKINITSSDLSHIIEKPMNYKWAETMNNILFHLKDTVLSEPFPTIKLYLSHWYPRSTKTLHIKILNTLSLLDK